MSERNNQKLLGLTFALFMSALLLLTGGCAGTSSDTDKYQRALDVQEIQNVMSRHAYYYSAGQHKRELEELWALDMADVCWHSDEGYWIGKDLIWEYYVDYFDEFRATDLKAFVELHPQIEFSDENLGSGTFMFHTNTTPVIEVAEDGKTAKGLWYSVGKLVQTPGGKQSPMNMWERYGVDFLKVDGEWKIWHFFVHTDISAGPGQSWAADDMKMPGGGEPGAMPEGFEPGAMPDGGGQPMMRGGGEAGESAGKPSPTIAPEGGDGRGPSYDPPTEYPKVPVPYRTFSETFSYGPPSE